MKRVITKTAKATAKSQSAGSQIAAVPSTTFHRLVTFQPPEVGRGELDPARRLTHKEFAAELQKPYAASSEVVTLPPDRHLLLEQAKLNLRATQAISSMTAILLWGTSYSACGYGINGPYARKKLVEDLSSDTVTSNGDTISGDVVLSLCREAMIEAAESCFGDSTLGPIFTAQCDKRNKKSVMWIFNRYCFAAGAHVTASQANFFCYPIAIRAIDAARELSDRREIKLSKKAQALIANLVKRDRLVMPESDFKAMAKHWDTDDLKYLHVSFGEKFIEALFEENDEERKKKFSGKNGLGEVASGLLDDQLRSAACLSFNGPKVRGEIRDAFPADIRYFEGVIRDYPSSPEIGPWDRGASGKVNEVARKSFSSRLRELELKLVEKKLHDVKQGRYSLGEDTAYRPNSVEIRKIISEVEREIANSQSKKSSWDTAKNGNQSGTVVMWKSRRPDSEPELRIELIDWKSILNDEIKAQKDEDLSYFTGEKLVDLYFKMTEFVSGGAFSLIDFGSYHSFGTKIKTPLHRALGDALATVARRFRDPCSADAPPCGKIACNNLIAISEMRKCWVRHENALDLARDERAEKERVEQMSETEIC